MKSMNKYIILLLLTILTGCTDLLQDSILNPLNNTNFLEDGSPDGSTGVLGSDVAFQNQNENAEDCQEFNVTKANVYVTEDQAFVSLESCDSREEISNFSYQEEAMLIMSAQLDEPLWAVHITDESKLFAKSYLESKIGMKATLMCQSMSDLFTFYAVYASLYEAEMNSFYMQMIDTTQINQPNINLIPVKEEEATSGIDLFLQGNERTFILDQDSTLTVLNENNEVIDFALGCHYVPFVLNEKR